MALEVCEFKRKVDMLEIDDDVTKRLKSGCSTRRLEDLSNELIYELYDYLDDWEIYEVFSQMNTRFESLFTTQNFRLKLNLPLTSKSIFSHRCTQLITPNIDRIVSISSSHYLTTDYFLKSFSIDSFIHLEALSLNGVSSNNLIPLLTHLATLSRFFSLSISCVDVWKNGNLVYRCIFRLPTIKYCKLKFLNHGDRKPLPFAVDKQDQCQTLEYLIIDSLYSLDQINAILTYTSRLTRLSCRIAWALCSNNAEGQAVLLHLKHLTVNFYKLSFDELEMFLSKIARQLISFRLVAACNGTFFRADRWEQLILNRMPHLRIFDFQYHISSDYPIDDHDNTDLIPFDRFKSTFWCDRNWFFEHQSDPGNDDDYEFSTLFYSTHPYRKKCYVHCQYVDNEDMEIHSASRLIIREQSESVLCQSHFPNVTKLTLIANFFDMNGQFIRDVNRIVPLTQIKFLFMEDQQLSIDQLIELLSFTSNILSLTFAQMFFLEFYPLSVKQMDKIRQLSMKNKINDLNIKHGCTLGHIHFFTNLCPRLQRLKIGIDATLMEPILQFLLSNKLPNLFSLTLLNTKVEAIKQIELIINSATLISNYSIEHANNTIHIWW